jgi:hypothetical protein
LLGYFSFVLNEGHGVFQTPWPFRFFASHLNTTELSQPLIANAKSSGNRAKIFVKAHKDRRIFGGS